VPRRTTPPQPSLPVAGGDTPRGPYNKPSQRAPASARNFFPRTPEVQRTPGGGWHRSRAALPKHRRPLVRGSTPCLGVLLTCVPLVACPVQDLLDLLARLNAVGAAVPRDIIARPRDIGAFPGVRPLRGL